MIIDRMTYVSVRVKEIFKEGRLLKWSFLFLSAVIIISLCLLLNTSEIENDTDKFESENPILSTEKSAIIDTRAVESCESGGCHQGIEPINPKMDYSCTTCHKGDGEAAEKNESHKGMFINPGDLNVVRGTCGQCHLNEIDRVKKSMHATMAGMISGSRYTWGAQDRNSSYSIFDIEDSDGNVPSENGALLSLSQIPNFQNSSEPIDDYLRNQCLRCHIWTEGKERAGDYRSSGCSACHVLYSDEGLYIGNDTTVNKEEAGHPLKHEITTRIPAEQCVHCHNRGGRTGVSFIGTMESDGYGTPFTDTGGKQSKLHGKNYNHLTPDVHYERGMQCIDCHTKNDIMGDGNIYAKKEEAVEIECTDCHGTPDEYPWDEEGKVKTSGAIKADGTIYGTPGGNEFTNIEKNGNTLTLTSKYDGKEHEIPILKLINETGSWKSTAAKTAMSSIPHIDSLECYACHAKWAPQCYGCHAKMDASQTGYDWVDAKEDATNSWEESRSYLRWGSPVLGINAEGKVSPFIPGCQAIFTYIDENGEVVVLNKIYTTTDGTSGIAHNPIQPHTISSSARTCEDCHTEQKTLGLGSGIFDPSGNGLNIDFELERIVDEDGKQIQATSHVGSRPFNKEEQEKISRVGLCIGCHQSYSDPIWNDVTDVVGFAENNDAHKSMMSLALSSISGSKPIMVFLAMDGHDSKIYLKWNFSESSEVDHYELYWNTSPITDVSALTPIVNTTNDSYVLEGLTAETTYYFALVAIDESGNISGVSFSNAEPALVQDVETTENASQITWLVGALVITILFVFILIIIIKRKKMGPLEHENKEEK